jgi:hypothetical protein
MFILTLAAAAVVLQVLEQLVSTFRQEMVGLRCITQPLDDHLEVVEVVQYTTINKVLSTQEVAVVVVQEMDKFNTLHRGTRQVQTLDLEVVAAQEMVVMVGLVFFFLVFRQLN